ncbi:hypothetical protein C1876_03100 [Eggerthella sinensis]|uniref:DUF981 domain-containing protein n=3 Tax=Eggerthella sinensis TaxID=242230 RepID=A0ABX9HLX9_9ACTN|nr:hypothetical protein [Eggerthella sinensis]RDB70712.1 hypothetical protein C1876_03100 [Eggerthella sinensis]
MGFDVTAGLALLVGGHASLAVCCGLYLAWWQVFFNPSAEKPHGARYAVGAACIVGAAVLGIAGVTLCVLGVQGLLPPEARGAALGGIVGCGAALYVVLLTGTVKLFKRPVTTELLLFVAWAALELGVLGVLHGAGLMGAPFALGLAALAVAVLLASLVCYVRYYRLEAWPAYVAGIIPLAASGAFAVAMTAVLALMFG